MSRRWARSRAMASLQFLGLPLPQDPLGGTLRYQTDHDEVGRATSCGPRTSRLMVKVLAEEAIRLERSDLQPHDRRPLLTEPGAAPRVCRRPGGRPKRAGPGQSRSGSSLFQAAVVVLAAGGPGELYRDSVYPTAASARSASRWRPGSRRSTSPRASSASARRAMVFRGTSPALTCRRCPTSSRVDAARREHNFLADYYRTTQELASNVFRKGYQWPFHATRMLDFGSSLVDLAIFRETQAGRSVFMDFNRNPQPVPGDATFSLDRLDDGRARLSRQRRRAAWRADRPAAQDEPALDRALQALQIDIAREPLEFAVNNQHMNGGLAVDAWGAHQPRGCYAVGEAAGTHGVTRPGGAALNAGQVFGTRAAEHIAARLARVTRRDLAAAAAVVDAVARDPRAPADSPLTVQSIRTAGPGPHERSRRHALQRGRASQRRSPPPAALNADHSRARHRLRPARPRR